MPFKGLIWFTFDFQQLGCTVTADRMLLSRSGPSWNEQLLPDGGEKSSGTIVQQRGKCERASSPVAGYLSDQRTAESNPRWNVGE